MKKKAASPRPYGLLAEFNTADALIAAAKSASDEGYRWVEAYTPFPVHGLVDALRYRHRKLPFLVLVGGLVGCAGGFFLQYYASVIDYPQNIAGRPDNSWPSFLVVTFELTILAAALTAVFGMLALNGLPMPHHPLFNVPEFKLASQEKFFLCIQARDNKFDAEKTRAFLERLEPVTVTEVEP